MFIVYGRWYDIVLYMNYRVKVWDMLNIVNCCREEKNLKLLRSLLIVLFCGKVKRVISI